MIWHCVLFEVKPRFESSIFNATGNSKLHQGTALLDISLTPPTTPAMTTKMEAVSTKEAPSPFPQFSQAIKYNGLVFCSGNVGLIPDTDLKLVQGTVKDRAVGIFTSATRASS